MSPTLSAGNSTNTPAGGYESYEATNAFGQRMGFVQIDTVDPYPAWQPDNPAAIYVAALASTRVAPSWGGEAIT
jgi:hypothetical protein